MRFKWAQRRRVNFEQELQDLEREFDRMDLLQHQLSLMLSLGWAQSSTIVSIAAMQKNDVDVAVDSLDHAAGLIITLTDSLKGLVDDVDEKVRANRRRLDELKALWHGR